MGKAQLDFDSFLTAYANADFQEIYPGAYGAGNHQ